MISGVGFLRPTVKSAYQWPRPFHEAKDVLATPGPKYASSIRPVIAKKDGIRGSSSPMPGTSCSVHCQEFTPDETACAVFGTVQVTLYSHPAGKVILNSASR